MLKTIYSTVLLFVLSALVTQTKAQVTFIENKGQWEPNIKYRAEIPGGLLIMEDGQLSYILHEKEPFDKIHDEGHYDQPVKMHFFRVVFEGSNKNLSYQTDFQSTAYYNYFIGNDPKKWASGVQGFGKVTVKELYPGIDLELFSSAKNIIKYNLIVKPGANPKKIKVRYEGLDDMRLSGGRLHLKTSLGELTEMPPVCYQFTDTSVKYVKTEYSLKDNVLSFDIKEKYNHRKSFIIDPELVFSTYSGAFGDNFGFTATYDNAGNAYSGGASYVYNQNGQFSDGSFPVTPGAFQMTFGGGQGFLARDAAIFKVSSDGSTLIYATYIGGSHNDEPHSMVVNSKGELVVLGTTFSNDFPVSGFDNFHNLSADIFVFVLSADGTDMIGSTYIGGPGMDGLNGDDDPGGTILAWNYGDQYRGEVIVDGADNIYVASSTASATNFPVKNAFQPVYLGAQDGCVFKLSSDASSLIWCSYLGGAGVDACNGLDLDAAGNVLVAGGTTDGIGAITAGKGEVTTRPGGVSDGFLVKISPDGSNVTSGTYLGTPGNYDQAYFVKVDKYDNPYVTGQTAGTWPVSNQIFTETGGGQFICKFTPDLQTRLRSMVFGKGTIRPQISLSAFLVDECERVFVSGWGGSTNAPGNGHGGNTVQMSKTPDAYQPNTDGSDFYLAVFSRNLDELLYATFLGGNGTDEHVDGGTSRFDRKGIVYQSVCAGCGGSSAFPTTPGAHSRTNNSANCNNAILKLDFENLNKAPVVNSAFYTVTAGGSLTFKIEATDADRYDSLTLEIDESSFANGFPDPKPVITKPGGKGIRSMEAFFAWNPDCDHVTGDTIFIPVKLTDEGCPDSKSDTAMIKVLVLPPPVIPPPGVLCLLPVTPTSVKLRWDNADTANPYFSHFMIVKTDPAGNVSNIGPFTKADKFEYTDNAVNDYRNNNYCYYIYSVNKCDVKGADSYTICSKDQFNAPIKSTEVVTATVVDNKDVKLVWKDSKEDDFDSYLIYRSPKSVHGVENYQFYASTNKTDDTTFTDTKVDVSEDAYCYKLQVIDQCGHISQFSNKGCNIVLTGTSRPYEHHLSWDTYNDWANGVDNFELVRWDSRQNPATSHQGPPVIRSHTDDTFDYDYGIYWYKIVATESGGNNAISESNTVKLVQKPLLHVPTAFTPNGDKLNDGWGQVDVFVKDYHLQVFNRWGEKVFESFDKNEQWTGDFKRTGPADNVFIWIVRYTGWDNSIHTQKGNVTILN